MKNSVWFKRFIASVILAIVPLLSAPAWGQLLQDQWYVGIGGGGAWLQPDPDQPGNNVSEAIGTGGSFTVGRDLDKNSSLQFQVAALGEAMLDDGNPVLYNAADLSVIYRFYDTRDKKLVPGGFGAGIYGRFGMGYMNRESDTELERESDVYFGLGAGTEVYITNNIALRFEGYMHDLDAISGSANLVFRFGGSTPRAARPASTTSESLPPADESQDSALSSAPEPEPTASPSDGVQEADLEAAASGAAGGAPSADDRDGDGIMNAGDQCADSNAGYPVRADGCPLFDGVLSGIRFVAGTAELEPSSFGQLDFLGLMLVNKYPNARIELHAHTDDEGDARSQSILTRARLRTVGTYLVGKGLRSNRMVLRSFGGSRPLYDNSTLEGRAANNRMEIFERPR